MPVATAASPWYKHLWPWIIIGILTCSVTLTLSMVTIAVNNPDNLVNDNYYEAGKGINRSLDRELLAQTLQLRANVHLDELTGEVELHLTGNSNPNTLELNLISPTQPEKDRRITLTRSDSEPSRYIGQVTDRSKAAASSSCSAWKGTRPGACSKRNRSATTRTCCWVTNRCRVPKT